MNRMIYIWNGMIVLTVGLLHAYVQTKAYGNHNVPQTTTEAIVDLISTMFILTGVVLFTIGCALPKNKS